MQRKMRNADVIWLREVDGPAIPNAIQQVSKGRQITVYFLRGSSAPPRLCVEMRVQLIDSGPSDRDSSISIASRLVFAAFTAESRPTS